MWRTLENKTLVIIERSGRCKTAVKWLSILHSQKKCFGWISIYIYISVWYILCFMLHSCVFCERVRFSNYPREIKLGSKYCVFKSFQLEFVSHPLKWIACNCTPLSVCGYFPINFTVNHIYLGCRQLRWANYDLIMKASIACNTKIQIFFSSVASVSIGWVLSPFWNVMKWKLIEMQAK